MNQPVTDSIDRVPHRLPHPSRDVGLFLWRPLLARGSACQFMRTRSLRIGPGNDRREVDVRVIVLLECLKTDGGRRENVDGGPPAGRRVGAQVHRQRRRILDLGRQSEPDGGA